MILNKIYRYHRSTLISKLRTQMHTKCKQISSRITYASDQKLIIYHKWRSVTYFDHSPFFSLNYALGLIKEWTIFPESSESFVIYALSKVVMSPNNYKGSSIMNNTLKLSNPRVLLTSWSNSLLRSNQVSTDTWGTFLHQALINSLYTKIQYTLSILLSVLYLNCWTSSCDTIQLFELRNIFTYTILWH